MTPVSLLQRGAYSLDWVKDFYDQTGIWWGAETDDPAEDVRRAATVERLCGPGPLRILELGAGAGRTAAALADRGHTVIGVELSPLRARQAQEVVGIARKGSLTVLEADFYTVELAGRFDVVCYWDGFGIGSDADHRRLLRRIARDWLTPTGCALVDVASTTWAARHAGTEEVLAPLQGVSGSVEMLRRWHFDALHGRWIDEWQPTAAPENTLAQTIRCYTPADFLLLLEGAGLALQRIEVDGQALDWEANRITTTGPLLEAYSYLVQLIPAGQV
ncbi:MAG: methyltransferase domain-containing protein [Chloroflexi bacterium]|nr:methyltransferase domain-containing protein [Chloroflexota bacterium]